MNNSLSNASVSKPWPGRGWKVKSCFTAPTEAQTSLGRCHPRAGKSLPLEKYTYISAPGLCLGRERNNGGDCFTPNHRLVCPAPAHRCLPPTAWSWLTFRKKCFIGLTPCQRLRSMRLLLREIACAITRQPGSPSELNTGQKPESPVTR